jgi:hypothetical protein
VKRILPFAIVLTAAGVCCIVAAYFCHFYYTLYRHASTDLEQSVDSRIKGLQDEVERLTRQKHFTSIRVRGVISTTDREADHWAGEITPDPGRYQLGYSKSGWVICPELRVPAGSVSEHRFEIALSPSSTRVIDAWISPPGQPEVLALFETFSVRPNEGTNSLTLTVRTKPGVSIKHPFSIVVLRDTAE